MLESGLQAAAASWASLLCVYMVAMAFQNCMLSIYFTNEFPIWYIPLVIFKLWRGKAPPMHTLGGHYPPALPAPLPLMSETREE